MSNAFEAFGGLSAIQSQCLACGATTALHSNGLAGCTRVLFPPESSAIHKVLVQNNLVEPYKSAFLLTDPIEFGLWVTSPLRHSQMEILRTLFSELPATR